jgi:rhodanese-related sulfurtransferase
MATADAPRMSPQELYARITKQEAVTILDVRTEAALTINPYKIPGARWMPLSSVVEQAQHLPRQGMVVAY